jgi:phosphonate transport system substrate-binding protein
MTVRNRRKEAPMPREYPEYPIPRLPQPLTEQGLMSLTRPGRGGRIYDARVMPISMHAIIVMGNSPFGWTENRGERRRQNNGFDRKNELAHARIDRGTMRRAPDHRVNRQGSKYGDNRPSSTRRRVLRQLAIVPLVAIPTIVRGKQSFQFGLTPVFLTSDLILLEALQTYLANALRTEVRLVLKRTYQEIVSPLVAGQINAAWICGYPFVVHRAQLELVAVPTWRGQNSYQSYLIVRDGRQAASIDDLRGDVHAFSDPDSNSGFLVTRALLADKRLRPESFFSRTFFTYGHRNVVRAVASGLAQSGSVDGYVWEVMMDAEPELTARTAVIWKSDWMGFPPVATSIINAADPQIGRFKDALLNMAGDALGRHVLKLLRLDGFGRPDSALFASIAARAELVRRHE